MSQAPTRKSLLIVGPGRLGLALGGELLHLETVSGIVFAGRSDLAPDHQLFGDDRVRYQPLHELTASPDSILLTVPDAAIEEVASTLAAAPLPAVRVLHTSGALGSDALQNLAAHHVATGSLHPLVSIADPDRDGHKLRRAWFGVEGAPAAVELARSWVEALDGRLIRVSPSGKPLYHAAAVFASNYAVSLLAVAERVMRQAGVEPESSREALSALALGSIQNVAAAGPIDALTGPISRGDVRTVELHLARLSEEDRPLYSVLARETLLLSQARGLSPEVAAQLADLIQRGTV